MMLCLKGRNQAVFTLKPPDNLGLRGSFAPPDILSVLLRDSLV